MALKIVELPRAPLPGGGAYRFFSLRILCSRPECAAEAPEHVGVNSRGDDEIARAMIEAKAVGWEERHEGTAMRFYCPAHKALP